MLSIFLRTVFIYFLTLVAIRVMGKREIGELTPFDLVVSLMIAELGVILIEDQSRTLWNAILPIATLSGIEIIISYLSLKSSKIRKLISGTPTVLIKNGELMEEEMRRSCYTLHDLLTQLRENSIFNPSDVEFAILETSGDLTVIPKSQNRGLTPDDLGIETEYEGLPGILISDGEINYTALDEAGLDENWLRHELSQRNIANPTEVLLAVLETDGNLYISTK